MDQPRNGRALPPLITIRALTQPKETPSPSLIRIRGFTNPADHRLLRELQHSDTTRADKQLIAKLQDENQVLRESCHAKMAELSRMKDDAKARGELQEIGREVDAILYQLRNEMWKISQEVNEILNQMKSEAQGAQRDFGSFNDSLEDHENMLTSAYLTIKRLSTQVQLFPKGDEQSQASDITDQWPYSPVSSTQGGNEELEDLKSQLAHLQDTVQQLKGEKQALAREKRTLTARNLELEGLVNISHNAQGQHSPVNSTQGGDEELEDLKSQLAHFQNTVQRLERENQSLGINNQALAKEKRTLTAKNLELDEFVNIGHNAIKDCNILKVLLEEAKASSRINLERFLSLRGAFRVCCRIRPPEDASTHQDADEDAKNLKLEMSKHRRGTTLTVTRYVDTAMSTPKSPQKRAEQKHWVVDQVFSSTDNNDVVWEEVEPLLESAKDGAPVLIILYGRTGTGKSWTSQGIWDHITTLVFPEVESNDGIEEPGVVARSVDNGDEPPQDSGEEDCISLWSAEIYLEELYDILPESQNKATKLRVPKITGIVDPADLCHHVKVVDGKGLEDALQRATRTRRSAQTNANQNSSRSHCFTCLELLGGGSIILADLAGHEKADDKADSAESRFINNSLSTLIDALSQLKTAINGANSSAKKGQIEQKPAQASKSRDIRQIWSPGLLPRIIGAMVLRGSESRRLSEQPELRSKVMFMATLDFSSAESTRSSETTLESLKVLAQAK